jgi:hypothetical protein
MTLASLGQACTDKFFFVSGLRFASLLTLASLGQDLRFASTFIPIMVVLVS